MNQFISQLPKAVLAIAVLAIGYAFIIWSDPPRTPCDEQLMSFKRTQRDFLYGRPSSGDNPLPPIIKTMFETCQLDNSPGGCFEYFERLRKFSRDIGELPKLCADTIAEDEAIQRWLFRSMKLMAMMAWGDHGPVSNTRKYGWFDSSELALFCKLKKNAITNFGQEAYDGWAQATVSELPGTEGIEHDLVFKKSLVSLPCEAYRSY